MTDNVAKLNSRKGDEKASSCHDALKAFGDEIPLLNRDRENFSKPALEIDQRSPNTSQS